MTSFGMTMTGFNKFEQDLDTWIQEVSGDIAWVIWTDVEYAAAVEIGRGKEHKYAQPHLFPAARKVYRELDQIANQFDSIDEIVEEAAKRIHSYTVKMCPVDTGKLQNSYVAEPL